MREHAYKYIYITRPKQERKKNTKYANGTNLVKVFFIIDRKYCFDTAKDFDFVIYITREAQCIILEKETHVITLG